MILVAGIGNIFLGDDAFGCEVAQRLAQRPLPQDVKVVDFGIRGLDLAYALLNDHEMVILVDAATRGGTPGSIYVIEPDLDENEPEMLDAHSMNPMRVLALARSMGALTHVRIVGCEPESCGPPDQGRMGLSPAVAAAVETALETIESLVALWPRSITV